MEDLGIPQSLMEDAAKMFSGGDFQMKVPPVAEAKRKDGRARWAEVFIVGQGYREVLESKAGDEHVVFSVKGQVVPAGDTLNGGKTHVARMRCNYKAMGLVAAADTAYIQAQAGGNAEEIIAAKAHLEKMHGKIPPLCGTWLYECTP